MVKLILSLIFLSFFFSGNTFAQDDLMSDRQDTTIIKTSLGKLEIIGFNYSLDNKSYIQYRTRGYYDLGSYRESILEEAEANDIVKDVVYVEFVQDSSCQITDIRIIKNGQLKSFNLYVTEWCNALKEKLSDLNDSILVGKDNEYFDCYSSIRLPLTLGLF